MMPSLFFAMLAITKLLYTLRSAPRFVLPILNDFDDLQCAILIDITNVHLEPKAPPGYKLPSQSTMVV